MHALYNIKPCEQNAVHVRASHPRMESYDWNYPVIGITLLWQVISDGPCMQVVGSAISHFLSALLLTISVLSRLPSFVVKRGVVFNIGVYYILILVKSCSLPLIIMPECNPLIFENQN